MIAAGLVTTIVPVYNRPVQLRECVQSVLAQEGTPIEVVIVDDGSTDATLEVARSLERDHGRHVVRVISQANAGPGAARETGRLAARGEFIQYLDSDDVLLPGKFAAQVAALRACPQCDVAYGKTRFRHADGRLEPHAWKGSGVARATMFPSFLLERWWDTPNPLYRRSVCDRAGPWSSLRLEEDWEYDCRIASLGGRLAWCDLDVCEVRDHAGERLCRGEALDPKRLAQRAASHRLIYAHARRAGLEPADAQMQTFARSLFLLARQCGAAALAAESRELFALAQEAAGETRGQSLDFRLYRSAAALVGWTWAGRASCWLDHARRSP